MVERRRALAFMDCGGKRSATPLWLFGSVVTLNTEDDPREPAPPEGKAPSPLRSAGAVHNVGGLSRGQSLDLPFMIRNTRITEPIVQAIRAALPKLDHFRHDPIPSPVRG